MYTLDSCTHQLQCVCVCWDVLHVVVPPSTVGRVSPAAGMLLVGLLAKNPTDRLGSEDAGGIVALMVRPLLFAVYIRVVYALLVMLAPSQAHPFFAGLDWDAVLTKAVKPLYVPRIAGGDDISNFDKVFTRVCARGWCRVLMQALLYQCVAARAGRPGVL